MIAPWRPQAGYAQKKEESSKKFLPILRKSLLKNSLIAFLIIFFLIPSAVFSAPDSDEKTLFSFINNEREREKAQKLEWDDDLYHVAMEHSKDMAEMEKVTHSSSKGLGPRERIVQSGIFASEFAENVAEDENVISAHTSLMESVYHR